MMDKVIFYDGPFENPLIVIVKNTVFEPKGNIL